MVWLGHGAFFVGVSFGVRLARVEMPHTAFGVGGGSVALSSQASLAQAAPEASGSGPSRPPPMLRALRALSNVRFAPIR